MTGTNFKDYGINIISTKDGDDATNTTGIDLSKIKKGFLLSKIDISSPETASDAEYSDEQIAEIKKALGAEEIPDEEAEKFGIKEHPLHKKHLDQLA
jgi:hypothetical protein